MRNINRVKTGIEGFDDLVSGGFPRGSNILVFGNPGSGKTNFGLEYIYRGAAENDEPGVYVSFEQNEKALISQADMFGWNLKKYIGKKVIVQTVGLHELSRDFAENILAAVHKIKAKRLVIDTLSLLSMSPLFSGEEKYTLSHNNKVHVAHNIKQFIYNLFHIINSASTTTLYLTMSDNNKAITLDGISEYLSDGIVYLGLRSLGKAYLRTLEVIKMRRTEILGGIHSFDISNNGIKVNCNE